jgi:hypothetical protein
VIGRPGTPRLVHHQSIPLHINCSFLLIVSSSCVRHPPRLIRYSPLAPQSKAFHNDDDDRRLQHSTCSGLCASRRDHSLDLSLKASVRIQILPELSVIKVSFWFFLDYLKLADLSLRLAYNVYLEGCFLMVVGGCSPSKSCHPWFGCTGVAIM